MPVPSSLADLSTSAGANSPSGSETPGQGDDYLRVLSSFLAQIRDKLNGTSDTGTIKNPAFSGTSTGTITLAGATLPTPIITGTPEFQGSAVNWAATTTHDGAHVWSGAQTFNGAATFASTAAFGGAVTFAVQPVGFAVGAVKTATTSRSSTTTEAADPHLTVSLTAGTWAFEVLAAVWATTSNAGGFRASLTFSGTATFSLTTIDSQHTTAAVVLNQAGAPTLIITGGSSNYDISSGVGNSGRVAFNGSIVVTAPGSLTFQWAQSSSNANAANVGLGSFIRCTRVA